jgi:NAD(P)-dependent dehydrogenase (short-subunit alcohol dehydrogenase family)
MRVQQLLDLAGRIALVTGASRGLGRQIAEALGEAGAALAITARRAEALEQSAAELRGLGFDCLAVRCDVGVEADVDDAVARTLERYGRIDVLVNNAGTAWGAPATDVAAADFVKVQQTNVVGTFLMSQRVGRHMIGRGYGRIVNVASVAGLRGTDPAVLDAVAYSASKGAVVTLTKDLAVKWASHGVTVNAIAPGFFPSRMTRAVLERSGEAILARCPMRRLGGPDDLKGVVLLLASDASAYLTGQVIAVDGGMTAW